MACPRGSSVKRGCHLLHPLLDYQRPYHHRGDCSDAQRSARVGEEAAGAEAEALAVPEGVAVACEPEVGVAAGELGGLADVGVGAVAVVPEIASWYL